MGHLVRELCFSTVRLDATRGKRTHTVARIQYIFQTLCSTVFSISCAMLISPKQTLQSEIRLHQVREAFLYVGWHARQDYASFEPPFNLQLFPDDFNQLENTPRRINWKQPARVWNRRYLQVQWVTRSLRFSVRFRSGVRLRFSIRLSNSTIWYTYTIGIHKVDSKLHRYLRVSGSPRLLHSVSNLQDTWTLFGFTGD